MKITFSDGYSIQVISLYIWCIVHVYRGPLLEGCQASAVVKRKIFLTDELKKTLCHHDLVNWAAAGELHLQTLLLFFVFFFNCEPGYIIHTINLLIIFYRIIIGEMPIFTLLIVMSCIHSLPAGHRMTIITIKWMRRKKENKTAAQSLAKIGLIYFVCMNIVQMWNIQTYSSHGWWLF